MSVSLGKRPNRTGDKVNLFLDFYVNDVRQRESLDMFLFTRPKTPSERKHNEDIRNLAEAIRSKKSLTHYEAGGAEVTPAFKKNINFIAYFQNYLDNYTKKDSRMIRACLLSFKTFLKEEHNKTVITPKELTEQLCIDFREYLDNKLNGETPSDYFARFKKVIKQAIREKILTSNPASDIRTFKPKDSILKDVLTFEEMQLLAQTPCGNDNVKRAFLLSCYTGLRYCDIEVLSWKHIKNGVLTINQLKTEKPVSIKLNPVSEKLMGAVGEPEDQVFKLPTHNSILKNLKNWTARAGIDKHITFHCGRHSFGTNLMMYDGNINTVASLLGHSSWKHTQKYVRAVESMREQAISKLPEISL
jgi:integrase/recombinase XerD